MNFEQVSSLLHTDASGVIGVARVIGRNDNENHGMVRIYPIHRSTKTWQYIESHEHEAFPFAEVLSPAKGENHGYYYTPEFGDFVLYTTLEGHHFIIGSISHPGKQPHTLTPVEAQNIQNNELEYNPSHYPDLTTKGYHSAEPKVADIYQPAAFLQRWRKNDFLIYNATKMNDEPHSAAKLMELRSAENQLLQLVDLGNFRTAPGHSGINSKEYSPVRQTDYRDLWEGFNVNREFWVDRTDFPAFTNESQYIRLASNGHEYAEVPHGDTGADLPDLVRGEFRWDDRLIDGSFETSKTYCPIYQAVLEAEGDERYFQDKSGPSSYAAGLPFRKKIKKWIEDTGDPYDPEAQHFNIGHYLILSNTIFKRRAMLSTKKGHQLVMSDIDKDEKIILNSHRGKYIYMEDSDAEHYDVMWFASQKHHMIFCDEQFAPYLIDDHGAERHRLLDPNQIDDSTYQLIQTEKYQKIWLADSPLCPRIHAHTTTGHEVLLLDHDQGVVGHHPATHEGKIQITNNHKNMQIVIDTMHGDITIQNHNLEGDSAGGRANTGDISLYAANNILLHADNMIQMRANLGYDIQSSAGSYNVVACGISHSTPCGAPSELEPIRPTVLTDIDVTEGVLINKWDWS